MELTPAEINWKIDAYNNAIKQRDRDIYDQAALIGLAMNNPKKFPESSKKFRQREPEKKRDLAEIEAEICRQAAIVGLRVPGG